MFISSQAAHAQESSFTQLSEGEVLVSASQLPPSDDQAWLPATLPYHNRGVPLVDRPQVVWHKFELEVPKIASAIYIWRYQTSVQVYLNDQYLGGTDEQQGWGTTTYWNHPFIVSIPTTSWRDGTNTLYVRVLGRGYGPVMSPILVGDAMAMLDLWQERMFHQVDSSFGAFVMCLLLAALAIWLWRLRPKETLFARYAGACISWSIVMWYFWGTYFPGDLLYFLIFMHLCVDLSLLLLIGFVEQAQSQRLIESTTHSSNQSKTEFKLERWLLGYWLVSIPILILSSADAFFYIAYFNHLMFVAALVIVMFMASFKALQQGISVSLWMLVAFVGIVVFALHDIVKFILFEDADWIAQQGISQFSTVFILLSFLGFLGQRFLAALNETDRLNEELEDRVARKQIELEKAYDKNLHLELARNSLKEKEKIYRDLHDDVGAKLVTIIQDDKSQAYGTLARSALENLRIAIFRTKYSHLALDQLLADSKEEAKLRAQAMGRDLEWQVSGSLAPITLRGEVAYHLSRILREAVSNSFKYGAGAPIVVLQSLVDENGLALTKSETSGSESNNSEPSNSEARQAQSILRWSISNRLDAVSLTTGFSSGIENIRFRADEVNADVQWRQVEQQLIFEMNLPLANVSFRESEA